MSNVDFNAIDFGDLFGDKPQGSAQVVIDTNKKTATPEQEPNIRVLNSNTNAPADVNPIGLLQGAQAKMNAIAVEMNNLFVERDELIKLMQLAITTGTNLLMLGMPGTARFNTTI